MKTITIVFSLLVSASTFSGVGTGHSHAQEHNHGAGGHKHGSSAKIDAEKAEKLARNKVRVLAFQEKIDKSWNDGELESAEIKTFEGKKEWLITLSNEKSKKGKKLYIFLKLDGEFVAANFTGK